MSCLWIWCCRGRGRKWRIHWKKGRKSRINKEEGGKEQKPVKVEEEAHALDLPVGLASSLSGETLEATAPPPQSSLTGEEDAAIQQLLKTLLDEVGARMGQLLKAETAQIAVAHEAAAEATNNTMNIVLEECEEKHLEKPVKVEEEAHALDLPVGLASSLSAETLEATAPPPQGSLTGEEDAAIQQLLKTLLDEVEARMGQLLKKPVKVEEEAHALDLPVGLASSLSAETLEATAPPPQGSLTGEEDAAIQQLLKTLLDEVEARMGQLLKAETAQIAVAHEAAAEATNNTMNIVLEECEEKHLEDAEVNDQTYPDLEDPVPTDIHPLAGDERLKDHVAEPETAKEHLDLKDTSFSADQPLDVKKSCPPENDKTNKRKTRRGTRGKGRKIIYNKDKHPDDKLDGQGS
ncbi:hypothetical protein SRHO_G00261420 [Serrasalmus rhombeus]